MDRATLYRTIWRWHFYAGLFVIPFILMLSVTGGIYLFKPQIDAWEEAAWRGPPTGAGDAPASPDTQVAAAIAALPGGTAISYRLPRAPREPAIVAVGVGGTTREVFVAPNGVVTAVVDPELRWANWLSRVHGSLLIGTIGSYLVETAASWAIVLILTGLYLWWPRGRGVTLAGMVWPRWGAGGRMLWRDVHAVTGFWVSGLALVLLVTALPWTDGWATAFRFVRAEMGWVSAVPPDWRGGSAPGPEHSHNAMGGSVQLASELRSVVTYATIARLAAREGLAFPVLIQPPFAPARFGPPNGNVWKLTSEAQNRPLIRTVLYDPQTAVVVQRQGFGDKHPLDRLINYGIAWHEGQLFGVVNQLIGVATALALITLAVSGTVMWWRRRPVGTLGALGAPAVPPDGKARGVIALLLVPALLLPMLALSLLMVAILDQLIMRIVRSNA